MKIDWKQYSDEYLNAVRLDSELLQNKLEGHIDKVVNKSLAVAGFYSTIGTFSVTQLIGTENFSFSDSFVFVSALVCSIIGIILNLWNILPVKRQITGSDPEVMFSKYFEEVDLDLQKRECEKAFIVGLLSSIPATRNLLEDLSFRLKLSLLLIPTFLVVSVVLFFFTI